MTATAMIAQPEMLVEADPSRAAARRAVASAARRALAGLPSARLPWAALVAAVAGALGFVLAARGAGPAAPVDPHLVLLLRFMALVKAAAALGAAALLHWRMRTAIAPSAAAAALAALALMSVAPGLIWSLALVVPGAICFHGGLFGALVFALRDDAAGRLFPGRLFPGRR